MVTYTPIPWWLEGRPWIEVRAWAATVAGIQADDQQAPEPPK